MKTRIRSILAVAVVAAAVLSGCGKCTGPAAAKGVRAAFRVAIVVPRSGSAASLEAAGKVRSLEATFGKASEGGMLSVFEPEYAAGEAARESWIAAVAALADDPGLKAVIVAPSPVGTAEAFRRIAEKRPGLLRLALASCEDPQAMQFASTLVVDADFVAQGYAAALAASRRSAVVFVETGRDPGSEARARMKAVMKATLADEGVPFVELDGAKARADRKPGVFAAFADAAVADAARRYGGRVGFFVPEQVSWIAFSEAARGTGAVMLGSQDPSLVALAAGLGLPPPAETMGAAAYAEASAKELEARFSPTGFLVCDEGAAAFLLERSVALAAIMVEKKSPADYVEAWNAAMPGPVSGGPLASHFIDPSIGVRARNHILVGLPLRGIGISIDRNREAPQQLYRFKP
ncbi:MAG: DUF3798 domain-containing protein [Spirochaetes bacterium]|nr:DUF3798 domain-containing protein [Spirochaetota bacterium]